MAIGLGFRIWGIGFRIYSVEFLDLAFVDDSLQPTVYILHVL